MEKIENGNVLVKHEFEFMKNYEWKTYFTMNLVI